MELGESMREHLAERVEDLVSEGVPREQAEFRARREFGNVTRLEEQGRAVWQWPRVESVWGDVKYALRQMRRSKGFAFAAVGTLALGIGAAAAMFVVVDHVLLRRLPYKDAARLVTMDERGRDRKTFLSPPWLDIEQWQQQSRSFEDIAFWAGKGRREKTRANGEWTTTNASGR